LSVKTKTIEERLSLRTAALHALGFVYDTEVGIFFREIPGRDPVVIIRDFVSDSPNDIFFQQYYRFHQLVKKIEKDEEDSGHG